MKGHLFSIVLSSLCDPPFIRIVACLIGLPLSTPCSVMQGTLLFGCSGQKEMIHRQIKARDGVMIHVVEAGNPSRPAVLFVHGLSQCWRSWLAQIAEAYLGTSSNRLETSNLSWSSPESVHWLFYLLVNRSGKGPPVGREACENRTAGSTVVDNAAAEAGTSRQRRRFCPLIRRTAGKILINADTIHAINM